MLHQQIYIIKIYERSVWVFFFISFADLPKFGERLQNITVPVGRDALLICVVDNLQTYKVMHATSLYPFYTTISTRSWCKHKKFTETKIHYFPHIRIKLYYLFDSYIKSAYTLRCWHNRDRHIYGVLVF